MKIYNRFTKKLIHDTVRANLCEADLREVDLRGADLYGANLCEADLREVDLCEANLREANLCGANLYGANLCGVDLYGANLCEANLCGANLCGANLYGADLREANLPAPSQLLLAGWGKVSDTLCISLMNHDADNHPNPDSFDEWQKTNKCPYSDIKIERVANFTEEVKLWKREPCKYSAFELMIMLFNEKNIKHNF